MSTDKPAGATPFPAHEWLDASAVAAMLGIARSTVYRYKNAGRLKADAEVGVTPLWHVTTVERYRDELAPRAIAARRHRAAREAAYQHRNSGQDDGTMATCGVCGAPIVYRTGRIGEETENEPSAGRWHDQEGGRAHHHGPGENGP